MGINTALKSANVFPRWNYFELDDYTIVNRGPSALDASLVVRWRAALRLARAATPSDPSTYTLENLQVCGPATFVGLRLQAICADALARASAYVTTGLPDYAAYALGQRDAIYAALQADGYF